MDANNANNANIANNDIDAINANNANIVINMNNGNTTPVTRIRKEMPNAPRKQNVRTLYGNVNENVRINLIDRFNGSESVQLNSIAHLNNRCGNLLFPYDPVQ